MKKPTKEVNPGIIRLYKSAYENLLILASVTDKQVFELTRMLDIPDDRAEREYA
jgi:hypothetical protein